MFDSSCLPVHTVEFSSPQHLVAKVSSTDLSLRWALAFLGCMAPLATMPAVVLDIDGTIVNNYVDGTTKAICFMQSFVQACVHNNIAIFVITARPDEPDNRAWTKKQLEQCSVSPIAKLYMRNPTADYGAYKFNARQEIRNQGYKVLLSIGDQFADVGDKSYAGLDDGMTYIGTLGDDGSYGIKFPSEFL